jgi:hypothetical protein
MSELFDPLGARPGTIPSSAAEGPSRERSWTGIVITLIGLLIFTIGAKPGWFGWDRSPGVGFVQLSVFTFGLGVICVGGLVGLLGLWKGTPRTLLSGIGIRLVATGYVISFFAAMADIIGFGSQPAQNLYFGPIEAAGVVIGEIVIALGFLMIIPLHIRPAR